MGNPSEPRCKVCQHPDRPSIEQALLNGQAMRAVARTFGLVYVDGKGVEQPDHKIVKRHIDNHMAALYQATRDQSLEEQGNALHRRMAELDVAVNEALARARAGEVVKYDDVPMLDDDGQPLRRYNDAALLAAVREARRNVDMHARLAGIMPEGNTDAADAARAALSDERARRAIAEAEAAVADAAARHERR